MKKTNISQIAIPSVKPAATKNTPLTAKEIRTLGRCEAAVEKNLEAAKNPVGPPVMINSVCVAFNLGEALLTIHNDELYRHAYPSFLDYCQRRWKIAKPEALYF